MTTMVMMMKMVKQRGALWQVSAISIVVGRGGNKKSVSITPIVTADHPWDPHRDSAFDYGHRQYSDEDGEDEGNDKEKTNVVYMV